MVRKMFNRDGDVAFTLVDVKKNPEELETPDE